MTIANLLTPELVLPALTATASAEVFEALAVRVGSVHPTLDPRRLADTLHAREQQSTTALENGVALPHARVEGLAGPVAALARTTTGVECGAVDGRPTQLFLLLIVAAENPGGHLRLLAGAARLLSDARCRARLLEVPTAGELVAVLREHEERSLRSLRAA